MLEEIFERYRKKAERFGRAKYNKQENSVWCKNVVDKLTELDLELKDVYVIITGIKHYFGSKPFPEGAVVHLIKEPSNHYDSRAIMAVCDGYGKCGYVANSENTVKQGTLSAELLFGGFDDICKAEVLWSDDVFVICRLLDITFKDILFKCGVNLCADGDYKSALKLFIRLEEKLADVEILQMICGCYIKLSDFETAKIYVNKAFEMDKHNPHTIHMQEVVAQNLTAK